jgi:hypothetical protein
MRYMVCTAMAWVLVSGCCAAQDRAKMSTWWSSCTEVGSKYDRFLELYNRGEYRVAANLLAPTWTCSSVDGHVTSRREWLTARDYAALRLPRDRYSHFQIVYVLPKDDRVLALVEYDQLWMFSVENNHSHCRRLDTWRRHKGELLWVSSVFVSPVSSSTFADTPQPAGRPTLPGRRGSGSL